MLERVENEISDSEQLLQMLLPDKLKKASMHFLEVETLRSIASAPTPQTKEQEAKETYEEVIR